MLQAYGGDGELIDVTEVEIVKLRLTGVRAGCSMSMMTLKLGVEKILKEEVYELKKVVTV